MTRNTIILLVVLGVLVGIAVLVMQKPGERSSSGETGEFLVSIDSLAVDRIEIQSSVGSVVLHKKGVEWFLQEPLEYRADQARIAGLIHDCRALEVKNIVSSKPEKFSVFQVDSLGTHIRLSESGNLKADFILGKMTTSFSEMYARRSGAHDVLVVSGAGAHAFSHPARDWRDKTVFAVARESIKEIQYRYGDTTFVLAFKDSIWTIGSTPALPEVVSNLLSSLSSVQADDFIDTVVSRTPKLTAQITYAGTQLNFFFIKQGEKYLVQSSSSPQWFEMPSWRANDILKRKKDLIKPGSQG